MIHQQPHSTSTCFQNLGLQICRLRTSTLLRVCVYVRVCVCVCVYVCAKERERERGPNAMISDHEIDLLGSLPPGGNFPDRIPVASTHTVPHTRIHTQTQTRRPSFWTPSLGPTCIHTNTHECNCIYVYMYMYMYMYIYKCIYIYIYLDIYTYI